LDLTFFNCGFFLNQLFLRMNFLKSFMLVFVLCCSANSLFAQETKSNKLVQFTGIIQNADSSSVVVPFVSITNISYKNQFFAANHQGYFSFVARELDTIEFSAIGYRTTQVVIPESEDSRYTGVIKMKASVTNLP